ncbi:Protein FAM48A [Chelonia mydas]|uniref:Protein FAM48A n=1 Tax=Chelonia mydas TaxID=8469 RepID=M7AJQ8_CHEMY|nr:Protein FAM48A [Chelonia mydas]
MAAPNGCGLLFIGRTCGRCSGAQTLMSGSNPMLGCNTGAITPAGINLSGILPSGGLVPNALPAAMQSASQTGSPFGLKNASGLRPLNLLQLPGGSLIFNPLQQQQLSQFSPQQQSPQPATSSPQQQGDQVCQLPSSAEQCPANQDQALSAQQAAVINLTGVGSFMQPQAAAVAILAASNGYGSSNSTSSSATTPATFRQPVQK